MTGLILVTCEVGQADHMEVAYGDDLIIEGFPNGTGYNLRGFMVNRHTEFDVYTPGLDSNAVIAGVMEWGTVGANLHLVAVAMGEPPANSICGGKVAGLENLQHGYDGRFTIISAPLSDGLIGLACWRADGSEADIVLDSTWGPMYTSENARTVTLHEVGHTVGIDHSDTIASIMAPYFAGPAHLQADDIAAIREVYGLAGTGPDCATRICKRIPMIVGDR